ncbi:7566_t:CDS:2, partial [Gigaspora rosea]
MDKLVENRDIFKKKFPQIAEALIKQQKDAIEKYDHIGYKQLAKKEISEEK